MNNHQITNFIRTYQDLPRYDNLVQFNHFWRRQMIRSGTTILMFLLLTTITEAKPLNNHLLIAQNNRETDCEEGEARNPETGECEETSDYDFEEDITIDEVDLEITITATKTPRFVLDSTASIVIVESEAI